MIRILLADEQGVMRAGLRALLQTANDLEVVGEAGNCANVLRLAEATRPDIVLTELGLPGTNGTELIHCLKEMDRHMRILVLTAQEDEEPFIKALSAGANGYIPKRAEGSDLLQAIYSVARGNYYIHHSLVRHLIARDMQLSYPKVKEPAEALSPREMDVLRLIVQGYTNRQAASKLNIGVRTVETHRARLMEKLGRHTRAELVDYASRHSLTGSIGGAEGD